MTTKQLNLIMTTTYFNNQQMVYLYNYVIYQFILAFTF